MPSGPNQHYLPRFLQKPFGILPKRKEIWKFAQNSPPEIKRIKDVGASDHFYSFPSVEGERSLDDDITEIETAVSNTLNLIRSKPLGSIIVSADAVEVFEHLVPRTAHVRMNMERGLRMMANGIGSVLGDEGRLQTLIGLDKNEPNDEFKSALASKLRELGNLESLVVPVSVIDEIAFFLTKENFVSLAADMLPPLREMLSSWVESSAGTAREIHNKTVQTASNSTPRSKKLQELNWSIQKGHPDAAILPDCVAIAFTLDGERAPAMFADWETIAAIAIPISPDKLLVGASPDFETRQLLEFNHAAARCSQDFFLAQANSECVADLQHLIGQRSTKLIEDGISGVFAEYIPAQPNPRSEDSPLFPIDLFEHSNESWDYELSFVGCDNSLDIHNTSDTIKEMVSTLSSAMPIQRLDGITIASNYLEAVSALDRGYEAASIPETAPKEIGTGVARTISVKRDGRWKERIVVDADVVLTLLGCDRANASWATYIITRQITEVAIPEIIERSLPAVWMCPIKDPLHSFLYPKVHPAIFSYLTSHICAGFGDTAQLANTKRELLVAALRELKSAVIDARLEYRFHGDLDVLLNITMPRIAFVLQFAADLLGHCAASGDKPVGSEHESELSVTLDDAGLEKWFKMFGDDLEKFRLRLGAWKSFDEFLFLDRHVKRLMWQMGMVPWNSPDGLRVEVPVETDINELIKVKQS